MINAVLIIYTVTKLFCYNGVFCGVFRDHSAGAPGSAGGVYCLVMVVSFFSCSNLRTSFITRRRLICAKLSRVLRTSDNLVVEPSSFSVLYPSGVGSKSSLINI